MNNTLKELIELIDEDCKFLASYGGQSQDCWHKQAIAFIEENWDVM